MVLRAVGPLLDAVAFLLVVDPVAVVLGAVEVDVLASTVGLVVHPLPLIDIAIRVNESTVPIGAVAVPVALVVGAIVPDLLTAATALAVEPLAFVVGT